MSPTVTEIDQNSIFKLIANSCVDRSEARAIIQVAVEQN